MWCVCCGAHSNPVPHTVLLHRDGHTNIFFGPYFLILGELSVSLLSDGQYTNTITTSGSFITVGEQSVYLGTVAQKR